MLLGIMCNITDEGRGWIFCRVPLWPIIREYYLYPRSQYNLPSVTELKQNGGEAVCQTFSALNKSKILTATFSFWEVGNSRLAKTIFGVHALYNVHGWFW